MTPFSAAPVLTAWAISSTMGTRAKLGANTAMQSTCFAISAMLA